MPRPSPQAATRKAVIYVNKLEAARRQLDAAIRMTFANEDELAIHTVAAAAYRILRDLLEKRGRNDHEELIRAGIYVYARSLANGEMSDVEIEQLSKMHLFPIVSKMAEDIREHGDQVTPDDMIFTMSNETKSSIWRSMSKVSNFLKHADKDANKHLPLEDVDNDLLLRHACAAYATASHAPTPEMAAFYTYSSSSPKYRAYLKGLNWSLPKKWRG